MANLITLEEYKLSEGLTSLKDDARLESLISSVSQLVKTYCGTSFVDYYNTDKVEVFNIEDPTNYIQLDESPIVSITTVEERASYSSNYVEITEGSYEFYLDAHSDGLYRTSSNGYVNWPIGPGSVKVTYKAGFASIPEDLKLAVIDLIRYYHKDEYKANRTSGGQTMTNETTSTQWRNVSFPDHIKRVLDLYKQIYS